ncbi:hypothetical protein [Wolbachia endosymbiont of Ctenocephalides felis wCfeJ]|uniref:hypothetical protein n=1 Tax=Wolbachia endosymbiont of Ctenocephalides felis wCfeJ TaxID=2732594 RepID=UPI0014484E7C|nr:hypothetical protein [Wolbachia endosymbiont of Ctenocephalides felis wCfeJ]
MKKEWIPVSSTGMTKKGHWDDIVEATWMTPLLLQYSHISHVPKQIQTYTNICLIRRRDYVY